MVAGPSNKRFRLNLSRALFILTTIIPILQNLTLADQSSSSAAASSASSSSETTTSQLISKANSLLASGQASKALELYDQALERDPDDYLTIYKKATTQISLGHLNHASQSFKRVLELKNDFEKARIQLSKIYLRLGDHQACKAELEKNSNKDSESIEFDKVLKDLRSVEAHEKAALKHQKSKSWEKCVEESSSAIRISPQSVNLRRLRSECHLIQGHLQEAAGDLSRVAQLSPNSASAALRVSMISYFFLADPLEKALPPIKQCLHSDPESKPCKKAFRMLKSTDKELTKVKNFINSNGYRSAIKILRPKGKPEEGLIVEVENHIRSAQKVDSKAGLEEALVSPSLPNLENRSSLLTKLYSYGCKAYVGLDEVESCQGLCEKLYEKDPEDPWGLVGKADKLMKNEEWEEAVRLLKVAYEKTNEDEKEIGDRLRRAQKGLKVSKQKDYYKVLGVSRNADEKTLKKAYRKATLKAHPDKGGSQAKMTALNEAYEVLSNPELRARYDNGDDPNDPMSGGGGGGNPFFQGGSAHPIFQQFFQQAGSAGGNPFAGGGGGQTFSFKFG